MLQDEILGLLAHVGSIALWALLSPALPVTPSSCCSVQCSPGSTVSTPGRSTQAWPNASALCTVESVTLSG
jgi:hypothetical protein